MDENDNGFGYLFSYYKIIGTLLLQFYKNFLFAPHLLQFCCKNVQLKSIMATVMVSTSEHKPL